MAGVSTQTFASVKSRTIYFWILSLLLVLSFTLATVLQPRAGTWTSRSGAENVLKVVLGDGRRLFANHFFVQADVSFHSGYYPSIFDHTALPKDSSHMIADSEQHDEHAGHACQGEHDHNSAKCSDDHAGCAHDHGEKGHEHDPHEKAMSFLGTPRDWVEAFGRRFMITEHTHLSAGNEREMLPWLKLSAELDPQRVDSYTVAAYWLRTLGKVDEAERFLRDGWRNNPNSYEILFELGRLYHEARKDIERTRNIWELALAKWGEQQANSDEPDLRALSQIAIHLGRMEESEGRLVRAVELLQLAQKASPNPEVLAKDIEELKHKATLPVKAP